ncbi:MAG: hypothetical protein WCF65_08835 [Parachlamydiaceae bacterium]
MREGVTHEHDKLVEQLLKSKSDENFNSILATHVLQSLFPGTNVKVVVTGKGYIVTGKVNDSVLSDNIIKILNVLAPNGEFPVLIPQGGNLIGTVTVDFKKFGVTLDFTPIVDLNGLITLHVVPEVSDIDRALSVVLNGFVIPGLRSRKADTTVKLWPGQSYLIAGLYLGHEQNLNDNLYGLNRIPFLGSLFGSNRYQDDRTELMIIITPYLIQNNVVQEWSWEAGNIDDNRRNVVCPIFTSKMALVACE